MSASPSFRRKNQKPVGFYVDEVFLEKLNQYLRKSRITKSQFIRDCIADRLRKEGIEIPDDLLIPLPPHVDKRIGG